MSSTRIRNRGLKSSSYQINRKLGKKWRGCKKKKGKNKNSNKKSSKKKTSIKKKIKSINNNLNTNRSNTRNRKETYMVKQDRSR